MSFNFSGKSVVLTGGASGIGLAIVKKFLKSGAAVTVGDYAPKSVVQSALDSLSSDKLPLDKVKFLNVDVGKLSDNEKLFQAALDTHGSADIVCANAGIGHLISFGDMSFEQWRRLLTINLDGVFMLNNLAVKHWIAREQPGIIVNTSSITGIRPLTDQSAYSCTKAAVNSITKSICKEYASKGIRANTVNPGFIRTHIFDGHEDLLQACIKTVPQGCAGETEDIANAVAFLASDLAKYVNGHCLVVDGGTTV